MIKLLIAIFLFLQLQSNVLAYDVEGFDLYGQADFVGFQPPQGVSVSNRAIIAQRFPVSFFETTDFLSVLWKNIANRFAHLDLSSIARGPHLSYLYLDELSPAQLILWNDWVQSLDESVLNQYGLLDEVPLFDPHHLSVTKVGLESKFIALEIGSEAKQKIASFYRLLMDRAPPEILQIHREKFLKAGVEPFNANRSHITLIKLEDTIGEGDVNKILVQMKTLLDELGPLLERHPHLWSLRKFPIRCTNPAISARVPGTVLTSHKWDPVARKFTPQGPLAWEYGFDRRQTKGSVIVRIHPDKGYRSTLNLQNLDWPSGRESVHPSTHALPNPHGDLNIEKGINILQRYQKVGFRAAGTVRFGSSVYASAARDSIHYPGDVDMMNFSLVEVPHSVTTIDEALNFAVDEIWKHYYEDNLRRLQDEGAIDLLEWRVGSEVSRDDLNGSLGPELLLEKYLRNPYLRIEDLHNEEKVKSLIRLRDWQKGKFDVYFDESGNVVTRYHQRFYEWLIAGKLTRQEYSVVLDAGFSWRGSTYYLDNQGVKGIPPLTHTMVYSDDESIEIARMLSRDHTVLATMKGPMDLVMANDLYKSSQKGQPGEVYLTTKLMKYFYNYYYFYKTYNQEFLNYVDYHLQVPGLKFSDSLLSKILASINRVPLDTIAKWRRGLNDFYELLESTENPSHIAMVARAVEFTQLREAIHQDVFAILPQDIKLIIDTNLPKLDAFMRHVFDNRGFINLSQIKRQEFIQAFKALEEAAYFVENFFHRSHPQLSKIEIEYLEKLAAMLPELTLRYKKATQGISDLEMQMIRVRAPSLRKVVKAGGGGGGVCGKFLSKVLSM